MDILVRDFLNRMDENEEGIYKDVMSQWKSCNSGQTMAQSYFAWKTQIEEEVNVFPILADSWREIHFDISERVTISPN